MLKKKPIIISAGCSFTDRFFKSHVTILPDHKRGGWPLWTDHFKDKLEKYHNEKYEIIHTGDSGGSLDFSLDHILKNIVIYKDRIKFVLWGGTEWSRWMDHHTHTRLNPVAALRRTKPIKKSNGVLLPKINNPLDYLNMFYDTAAAITMKSFCQKHGRINVLNNSFRQLWTVFNLCEQYNITLLYYQLLIPLPSISDMRFEFRRVLNENNDYKLGIDWDADPDFDARAAIKSPWFKDLLKNKKHFYGLQFLEPTEKHWGWEAKSHGVHDKLIVSPPTDETRALPEIRDKKGQNLRLDFHPNAEGQKDIAERLWKHYEINFL